MGFPYERAKADKKRIANETDNTEKKNLIQLLLY